MVKRLRKLPKAKRHLRHLIAAHLFTAKEVTALAAEAAMVAEGAWLAELAQVSGDSSAGKAALTAPREGMLCQHGDDRDAQKLEATLVASDHKLNLASEGVDLSHVLLINAGVDLVLNVFISPEYQKSSHSTVLKTLILSMLAKTISTEIQACKQLNLSPLLRTISNHYGECFSFYERKVASSFRYALRNRKFE